GCPGADTNSVCAIHKSSCFSRCLRVPIAMRRFYEQTLWIPQNFPPTNPDLHHGLLGNGDGTFQAPVTYSSGGAEPWGIAVADVNGDGKLDILVANAGSGSVGVLLGNGDGTFQAPVTYGSGQYSTSIVATDVNGDGKPDLVLADGSF